MMIYLFIFLSQGNAFYTLSLCCVWNIAGECIYSNSYYFIPFQEFIHHFCLILAENPWQAHLYWNMLNMFQDCVFASLYPLQQPWLLDAVSPQVSVALEYGKASSLTMLCSVHAYDCLNLFWFPHFKEQAPKRNNISKPNVEILLWDGLFPSSCIY